MTHKRVIDMYEKYRPKGEFKYGSTAKMSKAEIREFIDDMKYLTEVANMDDMDAYIIEREGDDG